MVTKSANVGNGGPRYEGFGAKGVKGWWWEIGIPSINPASHRGVGKGAVRLMDFPRSTADLIEGFEGTKVASALMATPVEVALILLWEVEVTSNESWHIRRMSDIESSFEHISLLSDAPVGHNVKGDDIE